MVLGIQGRVFGTREVVAALNKAPGLFVRYLTGWLYSERVKFVGKKGGEGGYRQILGSKPLWQRSGTWSSQVTGLFKAYVPNEARSVNDLYLRAGVGLNNPKAIHRALWALQTGGLVQARGNLMPIPVWKNLEAIGETGGKAFKRMAGAGDLFWVRSGAHMLWFNRDDMRINSSGAIGKVKARGEYAGVSWLFPKNALLFVGRRNIRQRPQFTGRYDFYGRWNRMLPAMISRGQGAIDRATRAVQAGKLN